MADNTSSEETAINNDNNSNNNIDAADAAAAVVGNDKIEKANDLLPDQAAIRIQGLARGKSVRRKDVLKVKREEKQRRDQQKAEMSAAAVQIQRHFRGFHLRNQMTQKDRDISKIQFRERHEAVSHVKAEDLHRTAAQIEKERKLEQADKMIAKKAQELKAEEKRSEEWAAVKIQSMYRGFSTRREQKTHRTMRTKTEKEFREHWQEMAKAEEEQTAMTLIRDNVIEVDNVRPAMPLQTDHLTQDGDRPSMLETRLKIQARRRHEHRLSDKELAALQYESDPTVPDSVQMKAMEAIRAATATWSSKYVMHIEPAAGSTSKHEVMKFLSVWSTPVLYRPVPRTTVHIHFSVPTQSLLQNAPVISFRVENQVLERTIGTTKGIPLKESWLDRVVMDKEQLKKTFKLAA